MSATGDIQVQLRDRKVFSSQKKLGRGEGRREGGKEKGLLEELRVQWKKQGLRIRWKWVQMLAAFLQPRDLMQVTQVTKSI